MPKSNLYEQRDINLESWRTFLRFKKNTVAVVGCWITVFLCLTALLAPILSPYPLDFQSDAILQPPSWDELGHVDHFFGTDDLGRDVLSRLIYGCQLSYGGSILVVLIAAAIGIPIGIFSGMSRGMKASILHHLMDTALAIPTLLIAIMLVSYLGPGLKNTLLAIALSQIPQFIRFTYLAVAAEVQKEYVTAIMLDGAKKSRILKFGILPNIADTIVAQLTRGFSSALIDITALGFIGLGAQAPLPEWGALLGSAYQLLFDAPWTVTLPGFAIMLSILSLNVFSDGLRKAMAEGLD